MLQHNNDASLQQQAETGDTHAQIELALELMDSNPGTPIEVISWLRKAATGHNTRALYLLGQCYVGNLNSELFSMNIDEQQAIYWFKRAAKLACVESMLALTDIYKSRANYDLMAHWLFMASDLGSDRAMERLGTMYFESARGVQDFDAAVDWFGCAAEYGNLDAIYMLGVCYHYGHGVEQNYLLARDWYQLAVRGRHTAACEALADLYYFGFGVNKDYLKAITWYNFAARGGSGKAHYRVGLMYQQGLGLSCNEEKARRYFDAAKALGYESLFA